MAVSDKISRVLPPQSESEIGQTPAQMAEIQRLVKEENMELSKARATVLGTKVEKKPVGEPKFKKEPPKPVSDKIPTKTYGAGIAIEKATEKQKEVNPKVVTEPVNRESAIKRSNFLPTTNMIASDQPAPVQPAKAPVAEAPQVKTAEVTGPKQETSEQKPEETEYDRMVKKVAELQAPKKEAAEDPYSSAKLGTGIQKVMESFPKETPPEQKMIPIYDPQTNEYVGSYPFVPGYDKTEFNVQFTGPVTEEDRQKVRDRAKKYEGMSEEEKARAEQARENIQYAKRDYETRREYSLKDMLAGMDENRKRDMWEKLIEAGGKVLSGVLGITNLPFLPETKGLDIAKHYKHTPVFDRKVEDELLQNKRKAEMEGLDKTFAESMDTLRPEAQKAEERAQEYNKMMLDAQKEAEGGKYTVQGSTKDVPPHFGTPIRPWKPEPAVSQGLSIDASEKEAHMKQSKDLSSIIENKKVTEYKSYVVPGMEPSGAKVRPENMKELDKIKVKTALDYFSKKEKMSPTEKGAYDAALKAYNAGASPIEVGRLLSRAFVDRDGLNVAAIVGSKLQAIVDAPVGAADKASQENLRNKLKWFTGINDLQVSEIVNGKPVNRGSLFNFQPTVPQQGERVRNFQQVDRTLDDPAWIQKLLPNEHPSGYRWNQPPIAPTLKDKNGNPVIDVNMFQNDQRSQRDMNLLLDPRLISALNGPWKFTLDSEKFVPGIYSPTGTSVLIGPGILVKHDKQAADLLQDSYVRYLSGDKSALETYKKTSWDFFRKVLKEHDPFFNGVLPEEFKKLPPNKQAVFRDLSWNGGPNTKAIPKLVSLMSIPKISDDVIKNFLENDESIPEIKTNYGKERALRRAALWVGSKK